MAWISVREHGFLMGGSYDENASLMSDHAHIYPLLMVHLYNENNMAFLRSNIFPPDKHLGNNQNLNVSCI